jgi:hypothetical protein
MTNCLITICFPSTHQKNHRTRQSVQLIPEESRPDPSPDSLRDPSEGGHAADLLSETHGSVKYGETSGPREIFAFVRFIIVIKMKCQITLG